LIAWLSRSLMLFASLRRAATPLPRGVPKRALSFPSLLKARGCRAANCRPRPQSDAAGAHNHGTSILSSSRRSRPDARGCHEPSHLSIGLEPDAARWGACDLTKTAIASGVAATTQELLLLTRSVQRTAHWFPLNRKTRQERGFQSNTEAAMKVHGGPGAESGLLRFAALFAPCPRDAAREAAHCIRRTPSADADSTWRTKYDAAGRNEVAVEKVGRRGSASYAVHFTPTRPVHLRIGGTYMVHLAAPLLLGPI
jgi:hypothetical protein